MSDRIFKKQIDGARKSVISSEYEGITGQDRVRFEYATIIYLIFSDRLEFPIYAPSINRSERSQKVAHMKMLIFSPLSFCAFFTPLDFSGNFRISPSIFRDFFRVRSQSHL
jgi:hypothetical protein